MDGSSKVLKVLTQEKLMYRPTKADSLVGGIHSMSIQMVGFYSIHSIERNT